MFEVRVDNGRDIEYSAKYDTSGEAVDDWTRLVALSTPEDDVDIILDFNDRGMVLMFDSVTRDAQVIQF